MGDDTNHQEISGMPSLPSPKPFQMCRHGSSRWLRAAPAAPALSARAARRATWTPGPGAQRGAALALCAEDEGLGESGGIRWWFREFGRAKLGGYVGLH